VKFVRPIPFKEAVARLGERSPIGSRLASADWARVPLALRERAFFSAQIENVRFLQRTRDWLRDFLEGARETVTRPDGTTVSALAVGGRARFIEQARRFALAQGMGPLDPKDARTLKDIRAERRLALIWQVQTTAAYEYGGWKQGNDPEVLEAFPAQRFIREVPVREPRDLHRMHEGEVRLKSDLGFWTALNRDFGVPWGPWGWGCGHGVEDVDRAEAERLGLLQPGQAVEAPELSFNEKLRASVTGLDPDLQDWLREQLGESLVIRDGAAWWRGRRGSRALALGREAGAAAGGEAAFPAGLEGLRVVRPLGGSTGADLVRDSRGTLWVRKLGVSPEHLREEAAAEALYRAAGVAVPESRLYAGPQPVKLARFIEGPTLGEFLATASAEQQAAVLARVRAGFAVDALLGNRDVAGLALDNLVVDAAGTPWRVDVGASLRFRARGARKAPGEFGPRVLELESLREARVNPAAARLFAGLTREELEAQRQALEARREAILAAAPAPLREVLAARLEDLRQRLVPPGGLEAPEFLRRLADARILGLAHRGDADKVEDLQVLFSQETRGERRGVVARWKLTGPGGEAVRAALGEAWPALERDEFWPKILAAIKTANKHAGDGAYNAATLRELAAVKQALTTAPPARRAMARYYLEIIAEIEQAVAARRPTRAGISPWAPPPARGKPGATWAAVRLEPWRFTRAERTRGHARRQEEVIFEVPEALRLSHASGAEVRLIPNEGTEAPYALRGWVEVWFPGEGAAAVRAIAKAASDLGVPLEEASPARREITYIARHLWLLQKRLSPMQVREWRALYEAELPEAEKAAKLRAWVQRRLGVAVDDPAVWQPEGRPNSFGYGFLRWDRFDLPRATVERELADLTLHHRVDERKAGLAQFIRSVLEGGGQVTPTTERLRQGIPITSGESPLEDLRTGGGSYFFTRIIPQAKARGRPGITFKIGNLARLDAYSYPGDYYGDVRPPGLNEHVRDPGKTRGVTLEEYRQFAQRESNETFFKNGFHLLDDVEAIRVRTAAEREAVLAAFRDHGYTRLPDGRPIEQVVQLVR
jgi:hypothetical protein